MQGLTRRAVLRGGVVGTSAVLLGGRAFADDLGPGDDQPAIPDGGTGELSASACAPSAPVRYGEINGYPTYYEDTFTDQNRRGPVTNFTYDRAFYAHCERWAQFWFRYNPWAAPVFIVSNGVTVDKGCGSWHTTGRAFDLSRIYTSNDSSTAYSQVCDANWHEWHDDPSVAWYAKLYGSEAGCGYRSWDSEPYRFRICEDTAGCSIWREADPWP